MACARADARGSEKHKRRMKAEKQKCLQEERCKRMKEQKRFLKGKSNEDMEVPQAIEKVLVSKGERAEMLSVNPDAVAQPVTVGKERVYLETYLRCR
ncbi:hypothetical protein TNCT_708501 [Trichonephila clavata]|uniref:Uncharacterized protein n=1 Tax=Trichonephila clavata TaxID=2740835 RepID=A0A8X6KXF5_TRICU|nr:hypothetical protein TNCT_708501 [Trichonephila clavata]